MKHITVLALLSAMLLSTAAIAQVSTTTNAGGTVGGTVDASTPAGTVGASTSTEVSAQVSTEVGNSSSSPVSSVSSEVSSALSGESSMLSSELSSMSDGSMSSGMQMDCDTFDPSVVATTAMDAAMLAAVTNVTVFAVDGCTGLPDLAGMDAGTNTALAANVMVTDALARAGESGADIIGYSVEDTSLVVYVRKAK